MDLEFLLIADNPPADYYYYPDSNKCGIRGGGIFLREFVGDFPWVHLDIAGTAYGEGKLPYHSKGATGTPTRLFVEWVLARSG